MGIPKTRKKSDLSSGDHGTAPPVQVVIEAEDQPEQKLDNAFKIIEQMEQQGKPRDTPFESPEPLKADPEEHKTAGFRWRISIEAAIPQEKTRHPNTSPAIEVAPIMNIGFTVPFLWKLPIIGSLTKRGINLLNKIRK